MPTKTKLSSSFRDPSGFVYEREGVLYRQINRCYQSTYDLAKSSGLYDELIEAGLLVSHVEESLELRASDEAALVIRPERISSISYPYEWCFSQLKEAAQLTLEIQRRAIDKGLCLKDASAYNVQFHKGRPVFIDTLSFEPYRPGEPWIAYGQFCRHFAAPLALMSLKDCRLGRMLSLFTDGIPLEIASNLLPWKTRLNLHFLSHIHVHSRSEKRSAGSSGVKVTITETGYRGILASLKQLIDGLNWAPKGTEWGDYYSNTNYSDDAMLAKERLVEEFIKAVPKPGITWDLGANTGRFSRLAAQQGIQTVAWDIDPAAVEKNYLDSRARKETHMLPLMQDLTNPSPSIGWALKERDSIVERGPVDLVMALALIHHLAIGNNVPLPQVASFFGEVGRHLIIEFVPKDDSQVQRLLANREDVFADYTEQQFEEAFEEEFEIIKREKVPGTSRTLYLLKRRF